MNRARKTRLGQVLVGLMVGTLGTVACKSDSPEPPPPAEPTPMAEPGIAPTTPEPAIRTEAEMTPVEKEEAGRILTEIHQVNALEMEAAKLAQTKARTEEVKDYAEALLEDHQKADQKVIEFAQEHEITLAAAGTTAGKPTEAHLTAQARSTLAKLTQAKPRRFEGVFLTAMVKSHQKTADKLTEVHGKVANEDLKSLVEEVKGSVQEHLEKARELQNKNDGKQAAGSTSARTQGRRVQQNR